MCCCMQADGRKQGLEYVMCPDGAHEGAVAVRGRALRLLITLAHRMKCSLCAGFNVFGQQ